MARLSRENGSKGVTLVSEGNASPQVIFSLLRSTGPELGELPVRADRQHVVEVVVTEKARPEVIDPLGDGGRQPCDAQFEAPLPSPFIRFRGILPPGWQASNIEVKGGNAGGDWG
jgi:hypothetical protein